jgi:hypothetical protein
MASLEIYSAMKAWKADSELLFLNSSGTENLMGEKTVLSSSLIFFNP